MQSAQFRFIVQTIRSPGLYFTILNIVSIKLKSEKQKVAFKFKEKKVSSSLKNKYRIRIKYRLVDVRFIEKYHK